jgi:hypothetical protein
MSTRGNDSAQPDLDPVAPHALEDACTAVEGVDVPSSERTQPFAEALRREEEATPVRVRVNGLAQDGARIIREFVTRPRKR